MDRKASHNVLTFNLNALAAMSGVGSRDWSDDETEAPGTTRKIERRPGLVACKTNGLIFAL